MPRPNWFLAFPLNGTFLQTLPALPKQFRLFHPADVHLTLAFLGPCGEEAASKAFSALASALAEHPLSAVDVSLAEVVPMGGSRRGYTALSALLAKGREEMTEHLAALRDPLLHAAGGRPDKRPPKPHVTLARPRTRATDVDRERGLEWAESAHLDGAPSRLDRVALYTWNEPRVDQFFRIVAEVHLLDPGAAPP